jgi:hypothetical protein
MSDGLMSLTLSQITNGNGFPKAAELIEITGTHALEASDRAIFNHLCRQPTTAAGSRNRMLSGRSRWRRSGVLRPAMRAMTASAR